VASLFKGNVGVACLFKGKGSWPDYLNKSGRGLIVSAETGSGLFD
jgi:hypothetical protein